MMARVSEISARVGAIAIVGDPELRILGVTHDSREVRDGFLFAALPGSAADGRKYVGQAIANGAAALLVSEAVDAPPTVVQIVVPDTRRALGEAAAVCYGDPTRDLSVAGITGTNGKTTTTYLVEAALRAEGGRPGVMGTVEYRFEGRRWHAAHTTPEAPVIQSIAREMTDAGATHLVMEVSSHGLALQRLRGCAFDVVAFSNLTQDHLDFHGSMADYAAAKMLLFTDAISQNSKARGVINVDDPFGEEIVRAMRHDVLRVSCDPAKAADLRPARAPSMSARGIEVEVVTPNGTIPLASPLVGAHNLSNLLLALGICLELGADAGRARDGLSGFAAVPGRLERVPCADGVAVLVDYAHTPDALARVLAALRPITPGRILCVFGCGGDRDPSKRPRMGEAVARAADVAVVTSDNPRTEKPGAIIDMIVPGVLDGGLQEIGAAEIARAPSGYIVEPDRAAAIRLAVGAARDGDTVLIAGKGHEDYQILGTEKIHFDDREQAATAVAARAPRGRA
ncbi:MAG: UDP-N-acetylmuramoyl-L-alanyl-D-glutamate--2,6-diaminopimelate ligase [Proteobacteria bacterium]|jgi:UDP-N-acetylmuramoyl-L-alanyl-D-glutamate--2,6-diaminopimelate ligase|nr:UDP-N-acetylmuramoyl-L-alanyl-D-glutamate--2,6-diaminopimelate ligase [Pseudomonadota bacterium]